MEQTDPPVAVITEEASNLPGSVVVIYREFSVNAIAVTRLSGFAYSTHVPLGS